MHARTGELGRGDDRPRIARLAGYRLVFQQLENEDPAYANILRPGAGVLGVIYCCSAAAFDALDGYEQGYVREEVRVTLAESEVVTATAYVMHAAPATRFASPSAEYLRKIVTGAKQHGLPETYVREITAIAANPPVGQGSP